MNFSPHNYQSYAINYIETHPIAAVLLDMGLGKTVISLTAIADLLFDSFEAHRILVVAPLRVARDTWPAEFFQKSGFKSKPLKKPGNTPLSGSYLSFLDINTTVSTVLSLSQQSSCVSLSPKYTGKRNFMCFRNLPSGCSCS